MQQCPICSAPVPKSGRYRHYICEDCVAKAESPDGRRLKFTNVSPSGGFIVKYDDTGEEYSSHECFVSGVRCHAEEAYLGGIVVEPVTLRKPATFWHNIAGANDEWWGLLKDRREIVTGFDNQPGDEGERILKRYVAGDRIVAYASGYGAVGWGVIERPNSYRLLPVGDDGDAHPKHRMRHRLSITWRAVAATLLEGIPPTELRERLGMYHPRSTSLRISDEKAAAILIAHLSDKFGPAVARAERQAP